MVSLRGLGVLSLTAVLAAACGNGKPPGCVGSECIDPGGPPVTQAGCKRDSDCADGVCLPDGTCSTPGTAQQKDACNPNPCQAGFFCANGACLPESPTCKPADPTCIYIPHGSFEPPVHQFWWPWETADGPNDKTGHATWRADLQYTDFVEVMMTPVVIRLHPNDTAPAIVFNSFNKNLAQPNFLETQGTLRAISGVDGSPIWTAPANFFQNQQWSTNGLSSIAAGDCKGDGEVCFITGGWNPDDAPPNVAPNMAHRHGGLVAFGSDGRPLWVNRDMQIWWGGASIARLLGPTGPAQVVVGNGVVDGATGKTLCPQTTSPYDQVGGNGEGTLTAVADIDLDGQPEIITGNNAYKLTPDSTSPTGYTCRPIFGFGVKVVNGSCPGGSGAYCPDGFPAIANFAGYGALMGLKPDDPHPQIVVVSHGFLRIQDWTGGILLNPVPLPADPNCTETNAGGAPTIADFDGDGLPEIGIAAQGAYVVWKPGKGFIWKQRTSDCSASTGSSVFDFEGKGQATAVYGDQCYVRVYDGKAGTPLITEQNQSCTAYEMPVVADIDGSGRAKIIIPTNDVCNYPCDWNGTPQGSGQFGLKILASPSDKWVNTRSVWNEHAYHVTNVNLDGTLPWPEPNSWDPKQSNTYRQNVQGQGVFNSPDLATCQVTADLTNCRQGQATATVVVYNGGAKVAKAGVSVHLYAEGAAGTVLVGKSATSKNLNPGDSENVLINWPAPSPTAPVKLKAVVDEENLVGDCHPENNVAESGTLTCPTIG